ncbi:hypothetical protein [Ktedonosporobacter rubrisoli]|uniref:hypothetical protein n=1 Tax=Ktedonosporobacter rubrisoli TaxID=2509675 RepID=UPI0013EE9895|nr:hypothetical protein [Ktedonosporobacter rubrisoli]
MFTFIFSSLEHTSWQLIASTVPLYQEIPVFMEPAQRPCLHVRDRGQRASRLTS